MIWCVEDDAGIREIELYTLKAAGFEVRAFADGASFWEALKNERPELILLDVMLPGLDGMELLRRLRKHPAYASIPVIMATAKGSEYDRIRGLDLGADDYLVKPFDILELLVRMEKVLARSAPAENKIIYQDITVDLDSRSVHKAGELISLKPMEYELLCTFMKHPGMVLTREKLLRQVWGDEYIGETRTVDVHVAALRKKLGLTEQLATVFKLGYRLEVEA